MRNASLCKLFSLWLYLTRNMPGSATNFGLVPQSAPEVAPGQFFWRNATEAGNILYRAA